MDNIKLSIHHIPRLSSQLLSKNRLNEFEQLITKYL